MRCRFPFEQHLEIIYRSKPNLSASAIKKTSELNDFASLCLCLALAEPLAVERVPNVAVRKRTGCTAPGDEIMPRPSQAEAPLERGTRYMAT
jgi:hypothetical protein